MSELWTAFQQAVESHPDRVALTTSDASLTFREVRDHAAGLADLLSDRGLGSGAVVHLALANVPAFLPALLALRSLDITVGLVSSRYRDAEFRAVTERMCPDAFLTSTQLAGVLDRSIDTGETREITWSGDHPPLSLVKPAVSPHESVHATALAIVKFTSGSTGAPKGVGLTEANVMAEAANIVATLGITSSDRIVASVPVSHSYGFDVGLLPVIVSGAHLVLRKSFIPREVFSDLSHHDTALFLGVPSMYRILVEADPADVPDLSHVRYLLSCTAPLLPSLVAQCHERLRVPVCQHYGSSETGAIANHRPADVLRLPESVGVPLAGVDVRIVDETGETLTAGQEGEIVVRSRAVAPGYVTDESTGASGAFVRADDDTTEYWTGDIGVIDNDGFIFWRGRRDQVINVGGFKVYPSEVVQVLERCPGVSGARVIGAKDQAGEEIVHAVVTLSQSMREQDILTYCRQHLADYKVPRRIEIAESISSPEAAKMSDLSGE